MSAVRQAAGFTHADLERMPEDDGLGYEIIDGELCVTPAPSTLHQVCVLQLARLLVAPATAAGLLVVPAPYDIAVADDTVPEPDVVVIHRDRVDEGAAHGSPELVVEVLSPRTRRTGLGHTRSRDARAGIPNHWVVDPATPALTAFGLRDAAHVEVARVEATPPSRRAPRSP